MNRNYILLKLSLDTLKYFKESQCLKIMGKVSYNIASVESYVHILSGQKFIKSEFGEFLKNRNLRSNSVTRQVNFHRTKIGENAKIEDFIMRHFW